MIDIERAVPDLTRPPTHPGPDGVAIYCLGQSGRCGRTLGVVSGGYFYSRHEGRETISDLTRPAWVQCERCKARRRVTR
jgi:hypothetical protein